MMSSENTVPPVPTSGLPEFMKKSERELYGWRVPRFPWVTDHVAHIESVRALKIRDDDVLIAAYPKSGTHWLWEVTHMLLNQTTEYEKRAKEQVMLEFAGALTRVEKEPSPRILNSHLMFPHLPQEIFTKKIKVIHVIRNPKDVVISMYHHYKQLDPTATFTFSEFLEQSMNNNLIFPSQFDYLRTVSEFQQRHPNNPIKNIYYEDMKKDPVKTISSLAEFLGVPASDTFCQQVAEACSFDNMKRVEDQGKKEMPKLNVSRPKGRGKLTIYRKGTIGDWKNVFTDEQRREFDAYIEREEKKGLAFTFTFE